MKKIIQVVLWSGGNSRISLCSVGQPAKDSRFKNGTMLSICKRNLASSAVEGPTPRYLTA